MRIEEYIGRPVSSLLENLPFKNWPVERSVEDELEEPIILYVFSGNGLQLRCDKDDKISVISLTCSDLATPDLTTLFEIPFGTTRLQVLEHFGEPSKSGGRVNDPILGNYGAWDRFSRSGHVIHLEYRIDADEIRRITLMRNDVVPS